MTVEGCVTRESAPPSVAAAAREPSAALRYVLTELRSPAPHVPDGSPLAVATGATPSDDQQRARRIYVLEATAPALDFAPHLNHTVRVTGTSRQSISSAPAAGASRTPPAPDVPTLDVTTLEKVSPTCR